MGKYDYLKSYERQIETIVIIISGIYIMTELILGYQNNWNPWGQFVVFLLGMAALILYIGKYKTYELRAHVTCFSVQIMLMVYGIEADDFYLILSLFVSLCMLMGLYGRPKIMIHAFIAYTGLVYYFIFIDKSLVWGSYSSDWGMVTRILQGYLTLFLVIYIVYRYEYSQASMLEMIDALRKSEREKDDFLANVSHEIRTPINTICGISEIMLKNEVPADMKEDVLNIQSAGRNLMSVVGDILDYSELQEGDFEIIEENYYVTSTIYDVINMSMAKKSEKQLELIVDCDGSMPSILCGDEQKIRRVIMNIVNNAIEFTNAGCVSISFGYRKEEYGINLIITVRDTGIGMSKENVENLFKKFSQADMGRTRKKGGVGLGLAISQTIVNRMGGFITVKSELEKGSEFRIVIPQKVAEESPIVEIQDKETINAAVYINMEQFRYGSIRDEYGSIIQNMIEQLGVNCHVCRNLMELKRWDKRENFNQIFISYQEYQEDPIYFDRMAKKQNVYIILDHYDDTKIQNKNLIKIYKPFFILSIVTAIRNAMQEQKKNVDVENHQLYAPEAHVLVIDDNRMNIRVVEGLMREYGVKVSYALSGQEGINMLESKAYDLILLDHMMPEMDGIETFQHIRHKSDSYYKEIPIIALTANAIAGAREMFMKEGFNDFLAKPVESSVLARVLKRHIPIEKQISKTEDMLFEERAAKLSKVNRTSNAVENTHASMAEKNTINSQKNADEEQTTAVSQNGELVIGDLDISKGIMYCGNQDNYLEILASQRDSGKEILGQAEDFYQKEDWKNYVIVVHGIKSSMMSIGAVKLSEMAKGLEFAGKGEDYDYIHNEHGAMVVEFQRVMDILKNSPYLAASDEAEADSTKPVISEEEFAQKLVELENATYEFDEKKVIPILNDLSQFAYGSKDLEKELKPVYKKVEMCDFMSAYEAVAKIKEKA